MDVKVKGWLLNFKRPPILTPFNSHFEIPLPFLTSMLQW